MLILVPSFSRRKRRRRYKELNFITVKID